MNVKIANVKVNFRNTNELQLAFYRNFDATAFFVLHFLLFLSDTKYRTVTTFTVKICQTISDNFQLTIKELIAYFINKCMVAYTKCCSKYVNMLRNTTQLGSCAFKQQ